MSAAIGRHRRRRSIASTGAQKVTGAARYAGESRSPDLAHARDGAQHDRARHARGDRREGRAERAGRARGAHAVQRDRTYRKAAWPASSRRRARAVAPAGRRSPLQRPADRASSSPIRSSTPCAAAALVRVAYAAERAPSLDFDRARQRERLPPKEARQHPSRPRRAAMSTAGLAAADVQHRRPSTRRRSRPTIRSSRTPRVAAWDGDQLTLHDATQGVFGVQQTLAKTFGIAGERRARRFSFRRRRLRLQGLGVVARGAGGDGGARSSGRPVQARARAAADVRPGGRPAAHRAARRARARRATAC